jgi:hypothetical protein
VNQDGNSKVRTTNINTQSSKKQKVAKEIKNIDKALGGIDKLIILAEIRSIHFLFFVFLFVLYIV